MNNYCTHGFNLFFVESAAVQKQCVDGVARPGCLDRRGCHIQEVLGRNMTQKVRQNRDYRHPNRKDCKQLHCMFIPEKNNVLESIVILLYCMQTTFLYHDVIVAVDHYWTATT